MLMPGVGSGTDNPTAPMTWVCFWPSTALVRTAPACRLRENGSKLPPISRNAALPPHEVTLTGSMSVLSEETPAVRVKVPTPSEAWPPHALPPNDAYGAGHARGGH